MRVVTIVLATLAAASVPVSAHAENDAVRVDRAFIRDGFVTVLVSAPNPTDRAVASERIECGAFDADRKALGSGVQYVTAIPPRTTVAAQILIPAPPNVAEAPVVAECRVTDLQ